MTLKSVRKKNYFHFFISLINTQTSRNDVDLMTQQAFYEVHLNWIETNKIITVKVCLDFQNIVTIHSYCRVESRDFVCLQLTISCVYVSQNCHFWHRYFTGIVTFDWHHWNFHTISTNISLSRDLNILVIFEFPHLIDERYHQNPKIPYFWKNLFLWSQALVWSFESSLQHSQCSKTDNHRDSMKKKKWTINEHLSLISHVRVSANIYMLNWIWANK